MNPLADSSLPLFFKVSNVDEINFKFPEQRHGDSLRTLVRSLSHMQKEALVASTRTGQVWRLASDEGAYLNGQDEAPCPLCFLTTGMVAATMNEILALAEQRNITIRNIRLIQDNYYTMKGSMLRGTMTGGAKDINLEAQIDSDTDSQTLQTLVTDACKMSPLNGLLENSIGSLFALSHNGEELIAAESKPLNKPLIPDESKHFTQAIAEPSTLGPLVTNTGVVTPKAAHTDSSAGSSLQNEQDRLLHIRGICTLRDDGVKQIEQHLFNPQGSIFKLLSEEAPTKGGKGRAPDAASYISAGIGFCFMTQFGRAAVIFKKELDSYSIAQDTFFSLAGASDKTGKAGSADKIETHCYLQSQFDTDYAQHVLGMAEQTCFLHALCKAELKTNITIATYQA